MGRGGGGLRRNRQPRHSGRGVDPGRRAVGWAARAVVENDHQSGAARAGTLQEAGEAFPVDALEAQHLSAGRLRSNQQGETNEQGRNDSQRRFSDSGKGRPDGAGRQAALRSGGGRLSRPA